MPVNDTKETSPKIEVFGREDCDVCKRIKKRIARLGFDFVNLNFDDYNEYSDDWRERGSCEVVAAYYVTSDEHLPVIRIDGKFLTVAKALKFLKGLLNGNTK